MNRNWFGRRRRRGGAAVEFALTFPVLTLVLAGTIDYGWYFTQQMIVQGIARDAARQGAAITDLDDAPATASSVGLLLLETQGIDCTALACTVVPQTSSVGSLDYLQVTVTMDFEPLAGMLYFGATTGLPFVPASVQGVAVMPLDAQF